MSRRLTVRGNRGRVSKPTVAFAAPPAPPPPGNTTDVIGVGATVADVIAINDANDNVQVGA